MLNELYIFINKSYLKIVDKSNNQVIQRFFLIDQTGYLIFTHQIYLLK